jgi:heme A synthase
VRASGAGAGCGAHWPLCNGVMLPHSPTLNTIIEFTHRVTSGVSLALVALLVVWAFRAYPKGHAARLGAVLSATFLLTEALIGASLVLLEHVAGNTSPYRAYSLSMHLLNTLTLLACLTLTAWWASGKARVAMRGRATGTLVAVMLLGVSGAIAALGDTLFPAKSLAQGFAQDFASGASIFVRLRWLHPAIAMAVACLVLWYATTNGVRRARWVLTLMAAQVCAGLLNLVLMAPVAMQMIHLLLAYAFWVSLVLLTAEDGRGDTMSACFDSPRS